METRPKQTNKKTHLYFISPQNKSSAISPKCKISLDFLYGYFMPFKGWAALVRCKAVLRQNCRAEKKWKIIVSLTTLPYQTWDLVGRRRDREAQSYWNRAGRGQGEEGCMAGHLQLETSDLIP